MLKILNLVSFFIKFSIYKKNFQILKRSYQRQKNYEEFQNKTTKTSKELATDAHTKIMFNNMNCRMKT